MEHRFAGPRYTVGVEEELMILDASSLDLVNRIDSILDGDPPPVILGPGARAVAVAPGVEEEVVELGGEEVGGPADRQ